MSGVGYVYRMAREAHGLSQREVAAEIGIGASTVGRIERDEVRPHDSLRWELIQLFATREPDAGQRERLRHKVWADSVEAVERDGRPTWGLAVRALRSIHGLSVEELAERAGATEDMIRRLEAGDRRFSDSLQERIARVLRADRDLLFSE